MKKGYIYSIVSAILFGSAGLIVKFAFIEGIDSVSLLTIQYLIAVSLMFLMILITNKKALKVSKELLFKLAILGIVGNTFMTVFYYLSFNYLPVPMVTILLYTYPIMIFLYSYIFNKEKVKKKQILSLTLAFVGCILALDLINGKVQYSLLGIFFGFLSAVFYSFMNLYTEKHLEEVEPLTINAYSTLFSLISLLIYKFPLFLFKGQVSFNLIGYTTILAIFCEIIPLTLLYAAIRHIGALKVSIIGNLEIPTAIILAYFLLKESMSLIQLIGSIIVIYAVYSIRH